MSLFNLTKCACACLRHSKGLTSSSPSLSVFSRFLGDKRDRGGGEGPKEDMATKTELPNEAVFYHSKRNMYICWHPEVPFPYEMSKPIPTTNVGTETELKVQALEPVKEVFRKKNKRLVLKELMHMTYTAKYKWMGMHGKKIKWARKAADPLKQKRNREYL